MCQVLVYLYRSPASYSNVNCIRRSKVEAKAVIFITNLCEIHLRKICFMHSLSYTDKFDCISQLLSHLLGDLIDSWPSNMHIVDSSHKQHTWHLHNNYWKKKISSVFHL
uniref:Uncharacterized protein n=1 Tax=Opuntia streptacantha TaxID=393608 RepID=A0A7C9AF09_OPUST